MRKPNRKAISFVSGFNSITHVDYLDFGGKNMQDNFRYIDYEEELNISKDNIGEIIDLALKESNKNTYGREAEEYIKFVC